MPERKCHKSWRVVLISATPDMPAATEPATAFIPQETHINYEGCLHLSVGPCALCVI